MEWFDIKATNGERVHIGIRKEYDVYPPNMKPLGGKWTLIWRAFGYKSVGYKKIEFMDFLSNDTPEDAASRLRSQCGHGDIWGFYEEIITRA